MRDSLVICPGIHDSSLTDSFLQVLAQQQISWEKTLVFPTNNYPAFSAFHLLQFLQEKSNISDSLVFISFSAGVVGAIGAALTWQQWGGNVRAFIALDGWGVPLWGNFPIYRLSHDQFTHWSSALLGGGEKNFYADPPVEHLDLWRSPDQVKGWLIGKTKDGNEIRSRTTASAFLSVLLMGMTREGDERQK